MKFLIFLLFYVIFFFYLININGRDYRLGFLFNNKNKYYEDNIGFEKSAGVVSMALDRIKQEQLLPSSANLSFYWKFDNCFESNSSGQSYILSEVYNVDFIFGPSCIPSIVKSSYVTRIYNTLLFVWGFVGGSQISNSQRFPNVFSALTTYYSLSFATIDFLKINNWTDIAYLIVPAEDKRCSRMFADFTIIMDNYFPQGNLRFSLITSSPPTKTNFDNFMEVTKPYSRIIISCFDRDDWKREFLLYLYDNGYNNNEWVHINMELRRRGFMNSKFDSNDNPILFYKDLSETNDGRDNDAFEMAKRMFVIDLNLDQLATSKLTETILNEIKNWPFYCDYCTTSSNRTGISTYAIFLYDVIYLWAILLNASIETYGEEKVNKNFTLLREFCNRTVVGIGNLMRYNQDCVRLSSFIVKGLDKDEHEISYINYTFYDQFIFDKIDMLPDLTNVMFENWDFEKPSNEPYCGYNENKCPINYFKDYLTISIIVIILIIIIIILILLVIIYIIYKIRKNAYIALTQWRIESYKLEKKENIDINTTQSFYSFQSGKTSKSSKNITNKVDSDRFMYVYYESVLVVAEKHNVLFFENTDDMKELTEIFLLNHSNINKFYGMSIDSSVTLSIWKYCTRGNIFDILQTDNPIFDLFFLMCLINDIIEGINFIHNSFIKFHGQLTSKNCLITDRWQVKISNFNSKDTRIREEINNEKRLWMAPEHIRNEDYLGSIQGDIYSFAIICSEIIGKTTPWGIEMKDDYIDEIIYLVKRGSSPPNRPEIIPHQNIEINSAFLILIKDCWNERPQDRPEIKNIKRIVTAMGEKKKKNLMDHVFSILENYAITLREEVNNRTEEVLEEQKKSDILLKKMLPVAVAENLKLGKSVQPETFDSVTVFFADVVKFTILSSKCSPLQVINLVNELFTKFDSIIESLDVYKVETIGDGYLCVSGLPIPNGIKHGKEIALLSLGFMDICNEFKIPHLLDEKINVRVGCNSGPCVAGVVGLSMPRYCLFGDTVNTASRMESNGRPGRIHISESYYKLLLEIGGFQLEERGSVIIKGKGVMTTFWLNGITDSTKYSNIAFIENDTKNNNDS
ncbi:Atrial natriuretic peptide receptor 1 [Strongyloides ratti]|uniref:Guanylate cyclase n=1 Tax=Strongyloides ratti TaxID=34506 RepID=A0A090LIU8_STRRB|nr:Atrial natriuretic peptide receptor 1 [Strongyloides ratti]CEF69663.1 Atrial natriuretic peptide receptor 1 [Strongyloides ratti]